MYVAIVILLFTIPLHPHLKEVHLVKLPELGMNCIGGGRGRHGEQLWVMQAAGLWNSR